MAVISFYRKESTLPTEVINMRHLGLMACLLLVGIGVAQNGFEHREFTNQEGVYLSYYINAGGFIENGELALTDGVVLTFAGSTGEPLEYESSAGITGILQFKPYDNTHFDLDVREGDYVVATYEFEGNFYSSDSPNA
jgi:hypothetical protein